MKKESNIYQRLWKIAFIVGIVVTAMLYFSYFYEDIPNLYMLPMAYVLSMLMVKGYYTEQNMGIAVTIIETTKFIRFVFLPLLYLFSDSFGRYLGLDMRYDYHTKAVLLMFYELTAVSFVMLLFLKYKAKERSNLSVSLDGITFKPGQTVILFSILWFILVLFVGKFREQLLNFEVTEAAGAMVKENSSNNILNIIFNFGKIYIYAGLLYFAKSSRDSFGRFTLILIASVLYISSNWTDGEASISRWGLIVSSLLSAYALYCYFPQKKKLILATAPVVMVVILAAGTLAKMMIWGYDTNDVNETTSTLFASNMFDLYFQGVYSVSNGLSTADMYAGKVGLINFVSELLYHFPFATPLLGLNGMWAEYYYKIGIGDVSQICPSLIQSYYYFGTLGSPFFSCLSVYLALFFTSKLEKERIFTLRLLYVYGIFWLSLYNCINYSIVEAHIWFSVIGIWVCSLDKKKKLTSSKINKITPQNIS